MFLLDRRAFLLGASSAAAVAGASRWRPASAQSREVTWGTNEAYGRPSFLAPFAESSGIGVNVELFSDPAEVVTKLAAGGAGVHVLLDGSYHVDISYAQGVLQSLDSSNVPNLGSVLPELRQADGLSFDGQRFGVPIFWGTDSMVYRHDMLGQDVDDLSALFDPQFAGRIAMPGGLFESLLVAALYLGIDNPFAMTQDELDAVADLLIKQKPLVRTYWTDIGDLKNLMGSGEVMLAWGWQTVMEIRRDGIDVRWAHPKQGELAWYDACYLTTEADGQTKEDSERFLNYLIGDHYGAAVGKEVGYRTSSTLAIEAMPADTREELDLDRASAFLEKAVWWLSPADPQAYQNTWDRVLNA